jgi:hypothetical protein
VIGLPVKSLVKFRVNHLGNRLLTCTFLVVVTVHFKLIMISCGGGLGSLGAGLGVVANEVNRESLAR